MKAKEVMNTFNITRQTLCAWAKDGRIQATKLPNGQYDYKLPEAGIGTINAVKQEPDAMVLTSADEEIQKLQNKTISDILTVNKEFYSWLVKINFMGPEFLNKTKEILESYEAAYDEISKR